MDRRKLFELVGEFGRITPHPRSVSRASARLDSNRFSPDGGEQPHAAAETRQTTDLAVQRQRSEQRGGPRLSERCGDPQQVIVIIIIRADGDGVTLVERLEQHREPLGVITAQLPGQAQQAAVDVAHPVEELGLVGRDGHHGRCGCGELAGREMNQDGNGARVGEDFGCAGCSQLRVGHRERRVILLDGGRWLLLFEQIRLGDPVVTQGRHAVALAMAGMGRHGGRPVRLAADKPTHRSEPGDQIRSLPFELLRVDDEKQCRQSQRMVADVLGQNAQQIDQRAAGLGRHVVGAAEYVTDGAHVDAGRPSPVVFAQLAREVGRVAAQLRRQRDDRRQRLGLGDQLSLLAPPVTPVRQPRTGQHRADELQCCAPRLGRTATQPPQQLRGVMGVADLWRVGPAGLFAVAALAEDLCSMVLRLQRRGEKSLGGKGIE